MKGTCSHRVYIEKGVKQYLQLGSMSEVAVCK